MKSNLPLPLSIIAPVGYTKTVEQSLQEYECNFEVSSNGYRGQSATQIKELKNLHIAGNSPTSFVLESENHRSSGVGKDAESHPPQDSGEVSEDEVDLGKVISLKSLGQFIDYQKEVESNSNSEYE